MPEGGITTRGSRETLTPATVRTTPPATYRISVRDFEALFSVGVYDYERCRRQRVRVNVDITLDEPPPGFADDLCEVLSYEHVIEHLRALAAGEHVALLETLAHMVIDRCFDDRRVRHVAVSIDKLDAFHDVEAVGVTIERGTRV